MTMRAWASVVVPLTLLVSTVAPPPPAADSDGPGFKTVHRFELSDPAEVAELASIMAEFNRFFEAEGTSARYRLWRVGEGGEEPVGYMWESTWTSRAQYDALHALPGYQSLLQRHMGALTGLLGDHEYVRYSEVALEPRAAGVSR